MNKQDNKKKKAQKLTVGETKRTTKRKGAPEKKQTKDDR